MSLDIQDLIEIQKKQLAKESNNKGAMSAEEIISRLEEFKQLRYICKKLNSYQDTFVQRYLIKELEIY